MYCCMHKLILLECVTTGRVRLCVYILYSANAVFILPAFFDEYYSLLLVFFMQLLFMQRVVIELLWLF